jgi:hypothetical protein
MGSVNDALFETGSNFRPGPLIPRIRFEIGQPSIKKGTLLACDKDGLLGKRLQ